MCLPTEHLRVHKNSLNCVRAFQIELEFGSVGFEGGVKPEYPEKNLSEDGREPTTNLNHAGVDARIRTRATLLGDECSRHCATLAPH